MKLKKVTSYALHALMYMVRHLTQLPVSIEAISKAEGVPKSNLTKIFKKLVDAGIVELATPRSKGYKFVNPPSHTSLMDLFEVMEGSGLFKDCFMKHCECGGTPENCYIYGAWQRSTKKMAALLTETSLVDAAWNHPEHKFNEHPTEMPVEP
ncbi:MAG: Rrf2 family transcriptional regulator [Planctomycetes bacterium]|nr:Rrf2 family transcriptional regulator [Planctomycetota bacterium]